MLKLTRLTVAFAAIVPAFQALAEEAPAAKASTPASCASVTEAQVAGLFDKWNASLATKDPAKVAANYAPDAVLLPTVANTATTPEAIQGYFVNFLKLQPQGKIDTRKIHVGCNDAFDVGTYTFTLTDKDGKTSKVSARYSFIYELKDGEWKIVHHHSSRMPEPATN